ncbi:MAG: MBL fold metallo-hydrolase [candidate division Zixibacteria bacterium]|nr:MBL fold metallo-hydrolase [candidate division Zixibacteria bacterium]
MISSLILLIAIIVYFSTDRLSQFGAKPDGVWLERAKQSSHFNGEKFVNSVPTDLKFGYKEYKNMLSKWFSGNEIREPQKDIKVDHLDSNAFESLSADDVNIVWLGHSSILLGIEGKNILIDPVWSDRCSPFSIIGPKRFFPVPIELGKLPHIDAVLISHDHFDHLDKDAVVTLAKSGVPFYVPLGVGAHLDRWDIDKSQIIEFDWWDNHSIKIDTLEIIATPGRHFSGRGLFSSTNSTFWVTWVIKSSNRSIFFCGDTGPFPGFKEIGEKYGPFDLTFMKIAAYSDQWPEIHLNPEQAIEAHIDLNGRKLIPIHWGTFNLAFHSWYEPPERLVKAAENNEVELIFPRPGQIIQLSAPPSLDYWWREYK